MIRDNGAKLRREGEERGRRRTWWDKGRRYEEKGGREGRRLRSER